MVVCTRCRKKLPDNYHFCIYCGAKISPQVPVPEFSVHVRFDKPDEHAIANFVEILNRKLAGIENRKQVVAALAAAEMKGSGIAPLVKIYRSFTGVSERDAETCMRSWCGQAYNKSAWQRAKECAPYKEWVGTPHSDRTRPSHLAMNGVIIPVDDYFVVPGFTDRFTGERIPEVLMLYPGDESQEPHISQVCRCRCVLVPCFVSKKKGPF